MGRPGPKKRVHNVFGCIDANSLKPPLLHPSHQKHSFAPRSLTSFHLYTLFSLVHSHSSPYALIFYLSSSTLFKITESLSLLLLLSICMAILPLLSCFFIYFEFWDLIVIKWHLTINYIFLYVYADRAHLKLLRLCLNDIWKRISKQ